MKLSSETLAVMKNFAGINSNLVLRAGNVVKTMAASKAIMAEAVIAEEIPSDIGIYDLNRFLGVLGMFSDPELEFDDDFRYVRIAEDNRSVKYFFSDINVLTKPKKDIVMESPDVSFTLNAADIAKIRDAAGKLGVGDCVIRCKPGEVSRLTVTDTGSSTSNSYSIDLDGLVGEDVTCEFIFSIENFKFLNDDYDVSICSKVVSDKVTKLISNFKSRESQVQYWVALEKGSTFGG